MVYKAQISTVHAFCAALLRESGHQIGLDPDFRLCDEGEGAVLMARVLGETLDRQYEDLDPEGDFAALVDTMAAGRDDSRLEQIVLDVFGRIQSHPDPAGWLADQSRLWELDGVTDAGDTPWGALLLADARRQGERCLELLLRALELTGRDSVLEPELRPQSLPVHPGGAGPAGGGQLGRRVPGPASGVPGGGAEKGRGGPGGGGAGEGTAHPLQEADGQAL